MNSKEAKFNLEKMYDVARVSKGIDYWFSKLLNICLNLFEWEGLPKTIPQREIELQLILTGHCLLFLKNNDIVTTYTSLYDFDNYYQPVKAVYAQPIIGSKSGITVNSMPAASPTDTNVLIYNSSLKDNIMGINADNSLLTFIQRYARLLADIESTIDIYMVNSRITNFPCAKNDKVAGSVRAFFNKFINGEHAVIEDDKIIEGFNVSPLPHQSSSDGIINLLDGRDKILEQFYRDIGIKFRNNKRAQMNEEEIESDEQVLLISLDDMLYQRQLGCDKIKQIFGDSVSVRINPKYDRNNYNNLRSNVNGRDNTTNN